ncbi:cobalamin-dependent protein [Patescibacteria group bacterium]|nr:cobalamin-dependent protein [Patescibacteria group bacterium]
MRKKRKLNQSKKRILLLINKPDYPKMLEQKVVPLGLAYIAGVLKEKGFQVKILDMTVEPLTEEDFQEFLKKFKPDIVGFTAMTPFYPGVKRWIALVKKVLPSTLTILGGAHTTLMKEKVLKENPALDMVVCGEGEETMLEIARGKDFDSILGIVFRIHKKIQTNPPRPFIKNLDSFPYPARDLLKLERYDLPLSILTSRGCPYRCIFCASSKIWGGFWRARSPENVVDEIDYLYKRFFNLRKKSVHGAEIAILDDVFNLNLNRAKKICDEIIKRKLNKKFVFGFWGMRADLIDKELVTKLREANCQQIWLGIESGEQQILDNLNKNLTLNQIRRGVRLIKEAGIKVGGNFMIGNPGENLSMARKSIKFAKELNLDWIGYNLITPFPTTKLDKWAKSHGRFLTKNWEDYAGFPYKDYEDKDSFYPVFETDDFSKEKRMKAFWEFEKLAHQR